MINIALRSPGLPALIETFEAIGQGAIDFSPLAVRVARIMEEGNRLARLEGIDKDGGRLEAVSESTRKRRLRDGGDPDADPFVPHGAASRAVTLEAEIAVDEPNHAVVVGEWPDAPWLGYHTRGEGYLPVRNIVGLTPWMREQMAIALREFLIDLLAARGGVFARE